MKTRHIMLAAILLSACVALAWAAPTTQPTDIHRPGCALSDASSPATAPDTGVSQASDADLDVPPPSSVPEPATTAFLVAGSVAMAAAGIRRRLRRGRI